MAGYMEKEAIDIIITYVNGNDEIWRNKRNRYECSKNGDGSVVRYRDWENLKYIFRGIERYAPWVRKVFLVTDHQTPDWVDPECDKLVLVNHEDYIPEEYLPTFNTNTIENNFHRIKDLSEQFIVFNDDCFFLQQVEPQDFFLKGQPQAMFMEYPVGCRGGNEVFPRLLLNNFIVLGKYFTRSDYKRCLRKKILNTAY